MAQRGGRSGQQAKPAPLVFRDHSAFLNSYTSEDEGALIGVMNSQSGGVEAERAGRGPNDAAIQIPSGGGSRGRFVVGIGAK